VPAASDPNQPQIRRPQHYARRRLRSAAVQRLSRADTIVPNPMMPSESKRATAQPVRGRSARLLHNQRNVSARQQAAIFHRADVTGIGPAGTALIQRRAIRAGIDQRATGQRHVI
jgi:hypothetical protein